VENTGVGLEGVFQETAGRWRERGERAPASTAPVGWPFGLSESFFTHRFCGRPHFFEGVSLRLFDLSDGLWRIYWIETTGAQLLPPVTGSFEGPDGVFQGEDAHLGRPVLVKFHWDRRDPDRPVWQQAFSADGGQSWETNWFMYFRRPDAALP
jgi:hypothetical protein